MVATRSVGVAKNARSKAPLASVPTCVRCITTADYDAWTAWTGKAPDLVHAFGIATTTGSFLNNISPFATCLSTIRSLCATWAGYRLAWALPLCTNTESLAAVAAGTHDAVILDMAAAILAHNPTGPIYVRIGWESGNFNCWPWNCTAATATDYKAAFVKMAGLLKARSNRIKIVWNLSAFNFDTGGAEVDMLTLGYPGDTSVDVIGIDAYMIGADVSSSMTFRRMSLGNNYVASAGFAYGIEYLAKYARSKNKSISFDEWGIGEDRPDYIRDMAQFIADPNNQVAYHGYWNRNAPDGSPPYTYPCRLTPDGGNDYPLAKAAFLDCYTGTGLAYTEQAETAAFFARTANKPNTARRSAFDTLMRTLKLNNLLDSVDGNPALDGLFILAGDAETSRMNVIGPGSFTTTTTRSGFLLTLVNSPTFTADRGFTGNGTNAYINVNINPTTVSPAGKFAQNSGHMGAWFLTNTNPGAQQIEVGNANSCIGRNPSGVWVGRPNTSSTVSLTNSGAAAGHVVWNRTAAGAWDAVLNGAAALNGVTASAALTNSNFNICGINAFPSFGSQQIAVFHWGRALRTGEAAALYAAFQTYLQALGAV